MEMNNDKKYCPIVDVDGVMASGKQFDLDITIGDDQRNAIFGVVKNCYGEPICDAVVKLIEIDCEHENERKPVSHTFTDKEGEFVFGPLCPNRFYEIQIWANQVKHYKICKTCNHEGKCLKGIKLDCPECGKGYGEKEDKQ